MDLRQLEHFLAVADDKHFTRAARRMNIVQSGLSASIRALESELGAELFVRTTRRVELTAAGQMLYDRALRIIAAVREARDSVAAVQGLARGKLFIGTAESLGLFIDLPALLGHFHARYPDVEIHLSQGSSTGLLEKLTNGQLDLAFVPLFEPPPGIVTTLITCEELVLICPVGHSLEGATDLSLAELKNEHFVDFQPGWGTRLIVDHAFNQARVYRHIGFEVSDITTLMDLVAHGLGIALVPAPLAVARADNSQNLPVAVATLGQPEICWELVLAFAGHEGSDAQPKNPAARAFMDVMRTVRSPTLAE